MTTTLLGRGFVHLALFTFLLIGRGCDYGGTTANVDDSVNFESMTLVHAFTITLLESDPIIPDTQPGKVIAVFDDITIEDRWKLDVLCREFPGTKTRIVWKTVDDLPTKLLLYVEKSQARDVKARLAELTPEWRSANERTLFVRKLDGLDAKEALGILHQAFPDAAFDADPTTGKLYIMCTEVESREVLATIRSLQQRRTGSQQPPK